MKNPDFTNVLFTSTRPHRADFRGATVSRIGRIFAAAFSNSLAKEFVAIVRSTR